MKYTLIYYGVTALMLSGIPAFAAPQGQQQMDDMRASFSPEREAKAPQIKVDSSSSMIRSVSPEDSRAMSQAAGRLLFHVNRARQAVDRQDKQAATDNVNKAIVLGQIIQANAPRYKLNTTIKSGDLQYHSEDEFASPLVTVFAGLERESIIGPLKQGNRPGMKQKAQQKTQDAQQQTAMRVADVDISAVTVQLNIENAQQDLNMARQALNAGNIQAADQALSHVQEDIVMTVAEVDAPIVRARENLALAKAYADAGQMEKAKQLLAQISTTLERFSKNVGEKESQRLNNMSQKIETANADVNNAKELSSKIDSWWNELQDMTLSS